LYETWLGRRDLFQTFDGLESVKDKPTDIEAVRQVLDEGDPAQDEEIVC
jgi:hypothetical protein